MKVEGIDVYFVHERVIESDERFVPIEGSNSLYTKVVNELVSNRGGETYCFHSDKHGNVWWQWARCSDKDNFCRKTGRDISFYNLKHAPFLLNIEGEYDLNKAGDRKVVFDYFFFGE